MNSPKKMETTVARTVSTPKQNSGLWKVYQQLATVLDGRQQDAAEVLREQKKTAPLHLLEMVF